MKKVVVVWNGKKTKQCTNRKHAENYIKFINYNKVYCIIEAEENEIETLILKAQAEQNRVMANAYEVFNNNLNRFGRNYR